ncbi:uncharacterized protein [Hemitrygon akajei]|uniref:uncharacterized protein isoform X2 n=1 Tax=Hemitrygon akajei TaxID=2704970 RepID=UPI003BF96AA1
MASECSKGCQMPEAGATTQVYSTEQDAANAGKITVEPRVKQGEAGEDAGDATAISDPEVKQGGVEGSNAMEKEGGAQLNSGDATIRSDEKKSARDTKGQCGSQHKKVEAGCSPSSSSSSSSESEGEGKTGCMQKKKKVKKGKADQMKGGSERDGAKTKAENCIC